MSHCCLEAAQSIFQLAVSHWLMLIEARSCAKTRPRHCSVADTSLPLQVHPKINLLRNFQTWDRFCFQLFIRKAISHSLSCPLPCTLPPAGLFVDRPNSRPPLAVITRARQRSTASNWKPLPFQSTDHDHRKLAYFPLVKDEANRFTTKNFISPLLAPKVHWNPSFSELACLPRPHNWTDSITEQYCIPRCLQTSCLRLATR